MQLAHTNMHVHRNVLSAKILECALNPILPQHNTVAVSHISILKLILTRILAVDFCLECFHKYKSRILSDRNCVALSGCTVSEHRIDLWISFERTRT